VSPDDGKIAWGFQYTPNDPYDFDEISENPLITTKVGGVDRKLMTHIGRNGFFYALDRTNGSFVAGKQYVDKLTWATGLDPKTGKPIEYNPAEDVQTYVLNSHGTRAKPLSAEKCPNTSGGKNWEPSAYNPSLNLIYIGSTEGCNQLQLIPQADMVDQGGTVKPRQNFTGGSGKNTGRLYGSLKSVDPTTGETKVNQRLDYPNWSGVMATASNLVFIGNVDGTFSAYDARTLKDVFDYSVGTGINAPAITYAFNGKQYVAVLVGSIQKAAILQQSPELKNTAPASMLYVFSL
jgi:alcohol dehydrogenase (cytochrome c)